MEISLQWQAMQDLKQRIANYEEIYETVQAAERDGDSMEKNQKSDIKSVAWKPRVVNTYRIIYIYIYTLYT